MIGLELGCPLPLCEWQQNVVHTAARIPEKNLLPDAHDYLLLYRGVVDHLIEVHDAKMPGDL